LTALLRHPAAQFAVLLLVALALRWDTFGDPNLHGDEVFYQTVGVAMHHGAVPYFDVWDRKPFGLFALSWLIAFFSSDMLAFQIAAALFAAGTAGAIAAIVRHLHALPDGTAGEFQGRFEAGLLPGLLAGVAYLLWLAPLQGFGGQSPVFYNLFIALAALLVVRSWPKLRAGTVPRAMLAAMLLAGIAITIKTSALFEAAFLGLFATWALWRSGAGGARIANHAASWVLTGAAPALAIMVGYFALGYWPEYWHAMVTSNLAKEIHWPTSLMRLKFMALALSPILVFAALGLMRLNRAARGFVIVWLIAALIGLFAVPNFYLHYALPLLVPLSLAASGFFARGSIGIAAVGILAFMAFTFAPPKPGRAAQSAAAIDTLETLARAHVGNGPLLLYDAPPQLYVRTGQPFITPLVFPTHLSHELERNVSHLDTLAETRRVLALKPGAVVMAYPVRNNPPNTDTQRLILAYVGQNCRLIDVVQTHERLRTDPIAVWSDCGQ